MATVVKCVNALKGLSTTHVGHQAEEVVESGEEVDSVFFNVNYLVTMYMIDLGE